jgi:hypothetical protein
MAFINQSELYERLFLLNRNLNQVKEILQQFREDGVIHAVFTAERLQSVENLRADLSYVLTGMFHRRDLEKCAGLTRKQIEHEEK